MKEERQWLFHCRHPSSAHDYYTRLLSCFQSRPQSPRADKKDCSLWERDCCVAYEQDQNTVRDLENRNGIRDLIANREAGFAKFWAQMGDWERNLIFGIIAMGEVGNAGLSWKRSGECGTLVKKGVEMRASRELGVGNAGRSWKRSGNAGLSGITSGNASTGLSF